MTGDYWLTLKMLLREADAISLRQTRCAADMNAIRFETERVLAECREMLRLADALLANDPWIEA